MVAASSVAVGLATFVNLLVPRLTGAAAAPNPLKGMLTLSNLASVIALLAIVTTPELLMVASPLMATPVATFPALPTKMLALFKLLTAPAA